MELGLADSMVPMHTVGRYLADMAEGQDIIEISDILRGEARIYSFRVQDEQAVPLAELGLPSAARAICIYRNGRNFLFAEPDTRLKTDDEVVVLTLAGSLKTLRERFG
jgi:trk system potassium uptake protein TrkA